MWAVVVLAFMLLAPASSFPLQDVDPSEVLLDDMDPEELDALFDSTLEKLKEDIVAIYESHLRRHHENIRNLHRRRRSEEDFPFLEDDYWHGYYYDLDVNNRELLTVHDMTAYEEPDILDITGVFPTNTKDMPFIYRSEPGLAYILRENELQPLYLKNKWTKTLTGCYCDIAGTMDCACCSAGGCQCQQSRGHSGSACVECGDETHDSKCIETEPEHLSVDSAVGFEHYNSYYDRKEGLIKTVVIASEKKVSMYRIGTDALEKMDEMVSHSSMQLATNATHLGYGEVFMDQEGHHTKVRLLFVFCANGGTHNVYRISSDGVDSSAGLTLTWKAKGSEMLTWQCGSRVMLGVLDKSNLDIYEMTANDLYHQSVRYVQQLSLVGEIISWRSYRAGAWDYLILASRNLIRVYVQLGTYYEPLQDILPTAAMTSFDGIVPMRVPTHRDKFLLLVGSGSSMVAYAFKGPRKERGDVFTGPRQEISEIYNGIIDAAIKNWTLGSCYGARDIPMVLLPGESGMVSLNFDLRLVPVTDPVKLQNRALQQTVDELEEMYINQHFSMERVKDRLEHSVVGKTEITADIFLHDIRVEDEIETALMNASTINIHHDNGNGTVHEQLYDEYVKEIGALDNQLTQLSTQVSNFSSTLDDAVSTQGSERTVSGTKTVIGALRTDSAIVQEATFSDTRDAFGNSFPLDQMLHNIVRVNDTRKISGKKTFNTELKVTHLNADFLDGIAVSDIVTIDGPQEIAGTVTMKALRAQRITLPEGGTVGGIDFSEEVVPIDGEASLDHCIFTDGAVVKGSLEVLSNRVNNRDFKRMVEKSLRVSGGTVSGPLIFNGTLSVEEVEAGAIMGVNTSEFMSSTVFRNKPASMAGTLTVRSQVTVGSDLAVSGRLNGNSFPGDIILRRTGETVNFGSKSLANASFGSLWLDEGARINGLKTSDFVTLDTPQTIYGRKVFTKGVEILGDLNIDTKRIDGVDLDELNASLSSSSRLRDASIDLVFLDEVSVPALSYGGSLNGQDFVEIASDIVYDDEPSATLTGRKVFTGEALHIRRADFKSTFNGHSFGDIVKTSEPSTIEGKTIFHNKVAFNTLNVNGTVDGVHLDQLLDSVLYLDKPGQVVTGKKTFVGTITSEQLEVNGKVSGVDFKKVLTKSGNQTFTAPQSFLSATFADVETQTIEMSDGYKVNGVDISELNKNRVSLTRPTEHSGHLIVNGAVDISGSFVADFVNGHSIWHLHENLVTHDQSSEIFSDLSFADLHVTGAVTTKDKVGANGFNISHIDENAVRLDSKNTMTGNATWSDIVFEGNVTVEGLVNGIDLQALSNDAVYRHTDTLQEIFGKKTFEKGFYVKGDIDTETTNGVDLRTKLLTLHTDQNITADYAFRDLRAQQNLTIEGTFNGIDLDAMAVLALLKAEENDIVNVTFHDEVRVDHLDLRGSLNNINIDEVLDDAIRLQDEDVVVTGRKTFVSNVSFRNIELQRLNDKDFDEFVSHAVFKNGSDVRMSRPVIVEGTVTAPAVVTTSLAVQKTIDGVDHKNLFGNAVYINRDYHFNKDVLFTNSISSLDNINVTFLNHANLMTDYLLKSVRQNFSGDVTFTNIVTADVDVKGNVNGYYLPDEVDNAVKRVGGQTFTGSMTLLSPVSVLNQTHITGRTGSRGDMVDLSEQVVLLNSDAEIQGAVTFLKPLRAASVSGTSGIVSGVDVEELVAKAWYLDAPANITADLNFTAPVTFSKGLQCNKEQNVEGICKLLEDTKSAQETYDALQKTIKEDIASQCPPTTSLFSSLQHAIYEGDHYVSVRESSTPFVHRASTSFTVAGTTFVVMSWAGQCDSTLFKFSPASGEIDPIQSLQDSGLGLDWSFVEIGDQSFVVMASDGSSSCAKANTVVWEVTDNKLKLYQDLRPGERISTLYQNNGDLKLIVHTVSQSWVYHFDVNARLFEERDVLSRHSEVTASLTTGNGMSLLFWSVGGLGSIAVEGGSGEVEVMDVKQVEDAVLVEQHGRVFLVATATQGWTAGDTRHIELYSVEGTEEKVTWLDSMEMSSPASLIALYAGNEESGSAMIIVLKDVGFPAVYTIHGERLRMLAELSTPRVRWALPIDSPGRVFPSMPDHYLLLGQEGNATVLAHLEMNGRAVPKYDLTCDLDSFTNLDDVANLDMI